MRVESKLAVMGLGNVLRGDDGVGVLLVRALSETLVPCPAYELIEAGVAGLRLLNWFDQFPAILAIDAAEMNLPPGSHRWIVPAQIASPGNPLFSLHDLDFSQTLGYAEKFFSRPPTVIFAVQPGSVQPSPTLSQPLAQALPHLVDHLRGALENWTADGALFPKASAETDPPCRDRILLDCLCRRTPNPCTNTN